MKCVRCGGEATEPLCPTCKEKQPEGGIPFGCGLLLVLGAVFVVCVLALLVSKPSPPTPSTLVIAASFIAAVRLARDDISRPSPRLTSVIAAVGGTFQPFFRNVPGGRFVTATWAPCGGAAQAIYEGYDQEFVFDVSKHQLEALIWLKPIFDHATN